MATYVHRSGWRYGSEEGIMHCESTVGELFRSFFTDEEQRIVESRLRAGLITLQDIANTLFLLKDIEEEDWSGLKNGARALLTGIEP